jgi:integrase/recombinase XerD
MKNEKIDLFRKILRIRGYSESSISNYVSTLNKYIGINGFEFSEELLTADFHNMRLNSYSTSSIRVAFMAIRLYLKLIENREFNISLLKEIKREHKLPDVLSKSEVKSILNSISILKHKTIVSLLYSCGLRVSECVNLNSNSPRIT